MTLRTKKDISSNSEFSEENKENNQYKEIFPHLKDITGNSIFTVNSQVNLHLKFKLNHLYFIPKQTELIKRE
jgi:hypothetical protein